MSTGGDPLDFTEDCQVFENTGLDLLRSITFDTATMKEF